MDQDQVQGNYEQEHKVEDRLNAYFNPAPAQPAESVTQQEQVPSSEQKTAEEVKPEQAQPEVAPQAKAEDDLALPEGVSDRTRQQFEKLKSRLREAEEKLSSPPTVPQNPPTQTEDYGASVFDYLRPPAEATPLPIDPLSVAPQMQPPQQINPNAGMYPGLNPLQVENITAQFIDREGNVDIYGLNKALSDANTRAIDAQEQAKRAYLETQRVQKDTADKIARFEETQQMREAYGTYPELNPKNKEKFDPAFYKLVSAELLDDRIKNRGKNSLSLLEAAQSVRRYYQTAPTTPPPAVIEQKAVEQYKKAQQARIQGPIEQGIGEARQPDLDYNELRARSRKGGLDNPYLNQRLNDYFSKK